jgi:riboflavin biosynthesis pyrimidine reductase
VRRLFPNPVNEIDVAEAYVADRRRPFHRPWIILSMVASVDGAITVEGGSHGLGGAGDRTIYRHLRSLADTVLVGAGTVRAEQYNPPRKPGQLVAIVTATGDLDLSWPLFTGGHAMLVMPENGPVVDAPTIRAGHDRVDVARAVEQLPGDIVLAEGGPTLNGDLLAAGLVDEVCITVAPLTVVGHAPRLAHGTIEVVRRLELAQVLTDDSGALYCRYLEGPRSGVDDAS